jgi:hypothetical protein
MLTTTTEVDVSHPTIIRARTSKDARPPAWRKGRLFIEVRQEHIDEALRASSSHCAIAMALQAALPDARFVSVDLQSVRFTDPRRGVRICFLTPHPARELIIGFDQGDAERCKPITFSMRPCTITKAGRKSQRHTPDAHQLADFKLKVAPVQAHIATGKSDEVGFESASPAEQELLDHWKPTDHERDPWAQDKPITPVKRKPRVARAKVSAAPKGSVPVTLGGKLPPTSVLSRREYGIRVLKR